MGGSRSACQCDSLVAKRVYSADCAAPQGKDGDGSAASYQNLKYWHMPESCKAAAQLADWHSADSWLWQGGSAGA